jgi:hypothetical protein
MWVGGGMIRYWVAMMALWVGMFVLFAGLTLAINGALGWYLGAVRDRWLTWNPLARYMVGVVGVVIAGAAIGWWVQ